MQWLVGRTVARVVTGLSTGAESMIAVLHRGWPSTDAAEPASAAVRRPQDQGMRILGLLVAVISSAPWMWPVGGPHDVVRPYIAPSTAYGAGHRGVDLAAPDGCRGRAGGWRRALRRCRGRPAGALDRPRRRGAVELRAGVVGARTRRCGRARAAARIGARRALLGRRCVHVGVRIDGQYVSPMRFLGVIPRAVLLPTRPLPSGAGVGQSVGLLELLAGDVRVELRGAEARVAEHLLHGAEVGSTVEEVRCRGVPEGVRA